MLDGNIDTYVLSVVLVLMAAAIAIWLIVKVTKRSIRSQLESTIARLSEVVAGPRGNADFATVGMGEVAWRPGGIVFPLEKTHAVLDEEAAKKEAAESFESLVSALSVHGVPNEDVVETKEPRVTARGTGFAYFSNATVAIRDISLKDAIVAAAKAAGYTEEQGADIVMIQSSDAGRSAAELAMDDAIVSAEAVADQLGLPRESLGMTSVRMESFSLPSTGHVAKRAEISWRAATPEPLAFRDA